MTNKDCFAHVPVGNIVLHWRLIKRNPSSSLCCSFFSLSDLFGVKLVSFLLSSSSWQGSWLSSPLMGRKHCRGFVFRNLHNFSFTYAFPGSSLLSFIKLRFFLGNNNIAWRCPKKPLIGWSGIICHHPDQGQSWHLTDSNHNWKSNWGLISHPQTWDEVFLHHSSTF